MARCLDITTTLVEETIGTKTMEAMVIMVEVGEAGNRQGSVEAIIMVTIGSKEATDISMSVKEGISDRTVIIKEVITSITMVDTVTNAKIAIVISSDKMTQVHHMSQVMMHPTSSLMKEP